MANSNSMPIITIPILNPFQLYCLVSSRRLRLSSVLSMHTHIVLSLHNFGKRISFGLFRILWHFASTLWIGLPFSRPSRHVSHSNSCHTFNWIQCKNCSHSFHHCHEYVSFNRPVLHWISLALSLSPPLSLIFFFVRPKRCSSIDLSSPDIATHISGIPLVTYFYRMASSLSNMDDRCPIQRRYWCIF